MNLFYERNSDLGVSQCFLNESYRTMLMKWVKEAENDGGFL
jgi:hypothetical protein